MKRIPAVFVSSTCYDLQQIRADINHFIEQELGYKALLSEKSSFPIDPDINTIENCRRRVYEDADVFILIIGCRYGYVDSSTSKSITNIEYLTAVAKQIPIYVFIDKCILPLLPVWERDHTVDLSAVVDNPKLFEFVGNIRKSGAWTHSFENAQDIIETLRVQLAYQMNDGLRLIHTLSQNPELNYLNGISGKAFRIALEQQDFWEYRLFGQVLTDEIEKQADIRFQYKNELRLGQRERIAFDETYPWLMACLDELRSFADAINKLMNETLQEALGPPGISGDARAILLNAQHIVSVYTHAIQWSQRISKAYVDPIFREVVGIAATLADDIIVQIESMAPRLIQELDAALLEPDCVGPRVINIIIKLDLPNADKLSDAMDKVEQELGL